MSTSNLIRWAGLANVVSGLLIALGTLLHPPEVAAAVSTSLWTVAHMLLLISLLFSIPGLFGLYARQAREIGRLGFVGFILTFVSLALFIGLLYFEALINPILASQAPEFVESQFTGQLPAGLLIAILLLTSLLFSLGWLLFGIATARARILPRWGAILTLIGAVPFGLWILILPAIAGKIGAVLFGLGIVWLGYALWTERGTMPAGQPRPAMSG